MIPTPQSIGEAGENMILTEGRRIWTTTDSVAKGNKEKMFSLSVQCRVFIHREWVRCGYWSHQCFCNLEICPRGTSQIITSFKTLLQIYWENTWICKIRSSLPAQTRNSLFSMLGILCGKPQPTQLPSHEPPRGRPHKIFDAQTETSVSERPDEVLHGILCPPPWLQLGYVDAKAQEAAQSIRRECVSSKQILAVINTQIYLQEAPSKKLHQKEDTTP